MTPIQGSACKLGYDHWSAKMMGQISAYSPAPHTRTPEPACGKLCPEGVFLPKSAPCTKSSHGPASGRLQEHKEPKTSEHTEITTSLGCPELGTAGRRSGTARGVRFPPAFLTALTVLFPGKPNAISAPYQGGRPSETWRKTNAERAKSKT